VLPQMSAHEHRRPQLCLPCRSTTRPKPVRFSPSLACSCRDASPGFCLFRARRIRAMCACARRVDPFHSGLQNRQCIRAVRTARSEPEINWSIISKSRFIRRHFFLKPQEPAPNFVFPYPISSSDACNKNAHAPRARRRFGPSLFPPCTFLSFPVER